MTGLPDGWRMLSLNEVAHGGLFNDGDWVETKDQDPQGSVRLTQLADVGVGEFRDRSSRWLREDQAASLGCTFLHPSDVLIARMPDPIGRACLAPDGIGRAITAVDVAILRVNDPEIDPRYVMWAVNNPKFHAAVESLQSGTTRKRISRKNLASLTIPIPALPEQRRIVDILEDHLSRLDAAESGIAFSIARLASLKERVLAAGLLGENMPGRREPSGLTDCGTDDGQLPDLPKGWAWRRLGEITSVAGGVTKDSKRQSDPAFVEVPYLRVANVQRGRLDLGKVTSIRVPASKARALRLLSGDVLMNEGGDRDKLARGWVWEGQVEDCIHQNHVFRARVVDGAIEPKLLSWAANTIGGRWAERNGKQSVNLASISLTKIRQMPVPVPPKDVQPERVKQLDDRLQACDRLAANLSEASARTATLRRSLMAAAFSGRLTARSHNLDVQKSTRS